MTAWSSSLAPRLIERLGWSLVHSVWQAAAVAVVTALVLRGLKRFSAQARYLVACGALAAMVLLPVTTTSLFERSKNERETSLAVVAQPTSKPADGGIHDDRSIPLEDWIERTPAIDAAGDRAARSRLASVSLRGSWLEPLLPWVVCAWGVGVLVLSLRLLGGWVCIQWLVRHETRPVAESWAKPLARLKERLNLARTVRLLESAAVQIPLAIGWMRPVILLPVTALLGLPLDQLEAILAHELAHVRRYDYLVNLVQSVIETLLFYHPAAWWISRRIRAEREHCCDDWAVELCGDRLTYTRALASLEEQRSSHWMLAPSAHDGSLLARVRRLLGVAPRAEKRAGGLAGSVAMAAVALLGVTLFLAPTTNRAQAGVDDRVAIFGTVVTAKGQPVADADVWLVAWAYPFNKSVTLGKARTDRAGRFRLVPDEQRLKARDLGWRVLWAHKPGLRPARVIPPKDETPLAFEPGRPVRVTLGPPTLTTFRVLDLAGKPVAGLTVAVVFLNDGRSYLPDELSNRLAQRSDADGNATVSVVPAEMIRIVRITSESFGTQLFYSGHDGFKLATNLFVQPVASAEGRVSADDPKAVRGVTVHLSTSTSDETRARGNGEAFVVTDQNGRFRVPALASGDLNVEAYLPEGSSFRAPRINIPKFNASRPMQIEVALKRLIRVRGIVRERGTGKPIEGVGVCLSSPDQVGALHFVQTDTEGRYEALALPGSTSYLHLTEPKAYLKQGRGIETPIGENEGQTLPPVELIRGLTLPGLVVDEEGKPVADATVDGKWDRIYPANSPDHPGMAIGRTFSATAKTDAQGHFLLEGIHPGANVSLEAVADEARTERPQQSAAGVATPVTLVISGANTVALLGRVVDATDQPIAGAMVQIRSRPLQENGFPDAEPVRFAESEIRTDVDGRFRTPRQLKRGHGYRAEIKSLNDALLPENTPWLALKTGTRPFFDKIVLRRLRTVRGRVVDSQGKPVEGASVRQAGDGPALTQAVTDSEGRFALPAVLAEPAFVFVAKNGYRFVGKSIGASDTAVEVTIHRVEEPLPKPLMTLPPPLPRTEELAILHRVFDGYAERVIKEGGRRELDEVLRILVWLDPVRANELLSEKRLDAWQPDNTRLSLATRLVQANHDDARALIEAIKDANMRSYAYSEASVALPETARDHRLELLNESLVAGRAVADPSQRVLRLADIGGRMSDIGMIEQATNLFREAEVIALELPTTGTSAWARGRLAEELAPIDLPGALNLLKGTESERDHDEYLGKMAREVAGKNPPEAERVLIRMRDVWPHSRDEAAQRVCYRMVTADRERAVSLASRIKNYRHRARALGRMALALEKNKKDHALAVRLLGEAFDLLEKAVASGIDDWDGLGVACTTAAGLLPIIEQVDARLLAEYLWRTLALRPPIPGPKGRDGISDIAAADIATRAARYDRTVARQTFSGFAERALALQIGLANWGPMFGGGEIFESSAIVDPARAAAMIESLREPTGLSSQELKNAARLKVARILARPTEDRWRDVERRLLHLWPIDLEDD